MLLLGKIVSVHYMLNEWSMLEHNMSRIVPFLGRIKEGKYIRYNYRKKPGRKW